MDRASWTLPRSCPRASVSRITRHESRPSQQSPLGKRHRARSADNEVIEHLDVDQRECLLESLSQNLVCTAGLGQARGMIVGKDYCSGVALESALHDFTWKNRSLCQRSVGQLLDR